MNPTNYVEAMFGGGNTLLTPQSESHMLDNDFTGVNNISIPNYLRVEHLHESNNPIDLVTLMKKKVQEVGKQKTK